VARSGKFSRTLTPFGAGRLNLDDAYRIETPAESSAPPTPAAPPAKVPASGSTRTVPVPKPPRVGKTPIPKTSAKKRAVRKRAVPKRAAGAAAKIVARGVGTGIKRTVPKPPVKTSGSTDPRWRGYVRGL
jgi:hypothetical protein